MLSRFRLRGDEGGGVLLSFLAGFALGHGVWADGLYYPQGIDILALGCLSLIVFLKPQKLTLTRWSALFATLPFYGWGLFWFYEPLIQMSVPYPYVLTFLLILFLSVYCVLVGWIGMRFFSTPISRIGGMGFVWTAGEIIRAYGLKIPYLTLTHAFMTLGVGINLMGLMGLYVFTVSIVSFVLLHFYTFKFKNPKGMMLLFFGWSGVVFFSWRPLDEVTFSQPAGIRLVQTIISDKDKWDPTLFESNLRHLITLSQKDQPPQLKAIIWPETAVTYLLTTDEVRRKEIAACIPKGGVLITGVPYADFLATPAVYRNRLIVMGDDGQIIDFYDKRHLLPFFEYAPFRIFQSKAHMNYDYSSGQEFKILNGPSGLNFFPFVCFDASFPPFYLNYLKKDDFLLNISNDIFLGSYGARLHFSHVSLVSIQLGRPLIRVSNGGISGVLYPSGRMPVYTGYGEESVRDCLFDGR